MYILVFTDGVPSSVASFNDSRCVAGGVCSTDPLLFTCELYHVTGIRVRLPNGEHESISLGDTAADIVLSAGYTATSVNITKIDEFLRNVHLTVYIVNASLLNGGEIMCDDHVGGDVMAACLLRSTCKYNKQKEERTNTVERLVTCRCACTPTLYLALCINGCSVHVLQ